MWLLVSLVISSAVTGGLVWWRYKNVCKPKNHTKIKEYRKTRKIKDNKNMHDTCICVNGTHFKEEQVKLNSSDTLININGHNSENSLIEEIDNTLCNLKQGDDTNILLPVMEVSDEERGVFNQERNNIKYFSI